MPNGANNLTPHVRAVMPIGYIAYDAWFNYIIARMAKVLHLRWQQLPGPPRKASSCRWNNLVKSSCTWHVSRSAIEIVALTVDIFASSIGDFNVTTTGVPKW